MLPYSFSRISISAICLLVCPGVVAVLAVVLPALPKMNLFSVSNLFLPRFVPCAKVVFLLVFVS